jgi:signal transduction histidine kinase
MRIRSLRWGAFGLRGRIVGAVLITTVATLSIAGLGLLPRLETSLRNASKLTLQEDLNSSGSELASFAKLRYAFIGEDKIPGLQRTKTADRAHLEAKALETAISRLVGRLGATNVTLVGYINAQGKGGRPVQAGPEADADSPGSYGNVAEAFLRNQRVYSFGSLGSKQVVQAVIPLKRSDAVLSISKSMDEIPAAVQAVEHAFTLAALAGLLLTLLLAIPLAGRLVSRLQRLRRAALRVAVQGAGAEFPVDRARDEVGDLARSFAIMQRRLRQQEEARRSFVATASHELRTPLASLDGMLELLADDLRDGEPDLEDATTLLERARAQSRRLGRLAADLLDLSRIDAQISLRSEPVELAELSRAVLAEFELPSRERGVAIELHDAGEPVWALADPGSVARILRILLDNALRVAPHNSDVRVVIAGGPRTSLSVIDQGPGVAQDERTLIFERFQRGRDTGGEAGFGLGLAIGRELAERMGGGLELLERSGPGAAFRLTLPAAAAPVEEPVPSGVST